MSDVYYFRNISPNPRECDKCGLPVHFGKKKDGQSIACDPDGQSHYYSGRCGTDEVVEYVPEQSKYYEGDREVPASKVSHPGVTSDAVQTEIAELNECFVVLREAVEDLFKEFRGLHRTIEERHQKMRAWAVTVEDRLRKVDTGTHGEPDVPDHDSGQEAGVDSGDSGTLAASGEGPTVRD